jgi:hypothetical protein
VREKPRVCDGALSLDNGLGNIGVPRRSKLPLGLLLSRTPPEHRSQDKTANLMGNHYRRSVS